MPETNEGDLVVDLPDSGDTVDIVLEAPPEEEKEGSAEHEDYSKNVRRRIDKLTKKAREAERQQEVAINYARDIQAQNNELQSRVQSLDQGYVSEYGDRIASQSDSLSRDMETAIATNDTAAQVELNKKMARLAIEEERVRNAKQQQAQQQQAQQPQAQQQQVNGDRRVAPPVRPDPEAVSWANRNAWFGEDEAMTFAAFGIHKRLVEEEGFDTDTSEYYDEVDARIREAFPHKFNGGSSTTASRRPQQSVASATRSGSSGRKTVRLSPSEVAIAKKLGVPLDQYAKHKR